MKIIKIWIALVLCAAQGPAWSQSEAPKRRISKIAGGLYRFQNNHHFSVFLVTSDGVLVMDPINAQAAGWLKTEIAKRFKQPVRYLVYSHDHEDHSSGGEVFADDGAIVISHKNAKRAILGEKRPTATPQISFDKELSIELGGELVILNYHGRNHSDNMITLLYPAHRILYAVDFIPVKTVAYKTLRDSWFPDWVRSVSRVEHMDFDVLVPGHGEVGSKADVSLFKNYLRDLYNQVQILVRQGKTLEQTQAAVDLSKYQSMAQYADWMPLNVEGVYQRIQQHRRDN